MASSIRFLRSTSTSYSCARAISMAVMRPDTSAPTWARGRRGIQPPQRIRSDDAVAEAAVQSHVAKCECGDRLLQHPAKPRRRARRAHRVLRGGAEGVIETALPAGTG